LTQGANESKDGVLENSDFLNGLKVKDAIKLAIQKVVEQGFGKGNINYRLRDAVFGRQRYWGEPIPIYYKDGIPYPIKEEHLPVVLPEINEYLPTETGEPPLGRAKGWGYDPERGAVNDGSGLGIELSTMPGWAGSSWYFLRYMDPKNTDAFATKDAVNYWQNIDLYVGGSEHATGHLLYVRFWTKFLKDLGYLPFDEPAKKLVNQGMIQGVSQKVYFEKNRTNQVYVNVLNENVPLKESVTRFISSDVFEEGMKLYKDANDIHGLNSYLDKYTERNLPIQFDNGGFYRIDELVTSSIGKDFLGSVFVSGSTASYISSEGEMKVIKDGLPKEQKDFKTKSEVEKMSKSKWNVVNPDDIISRYGADTLRLYEMFLGPLEDAKPWNTNGIEGTYRFLRKFWNLFLVDGQFSVSSEAPSKPELKALHATIRKIEDDIEKLSLNTSISQFMICVNELTELKCNKRAILEPLTIVLSSFAPHIAEELWEQLGNTSSISFASYPKFEAAHLVEDSFSYPISFNGKTKMNLELSTSLSAAEVEAIVLANADVIQRLEGATPKKVIVVVKRIVNVVV
jgi:leucyl-tRNA synthetase